MRSILEHALRHRIFVPRELIFFDMAVRGFKKNRAGLDQVEACLRKKRASALLLFSTSRLFRKQYRTLEFVDRIHKGLNVRCVFVKSGVDTNDKQRWETILSTQAMIDQFVVTMNIANVQAAQEGLLRKQLVFGTLGIGYTGEIIEGELTKLGRPRRRIIIDPSTCEVVRQIFSWYVNDELSINEIVGRLNTDPNIPLPPGANSGQWTRHSVSRLLRNTRYRGLWKYGVMEAVYVPDADYTRQRMRSEPLRQTQIDELRIVSDDTWYAAQVRLAKRSRNAGRRPVDGDQKRRPKVINDFLTCPGHGRLHVSGTFGRHMHCPVCSRLPWNERNLVSDLNRELALQLVCEKTGELVRGDQLLLQDALAACDLEVEAAQRPDPARLVQLRSQLDNINRIIAFTRRSVGATSDDQADAERFVKEQQRERSGITADIERLEAAIAKVPRKPQEAEVRQAIEDLGTILFQAAEGNDDLDAATVRQVLVLLTGGKIELHQMGERKRQRGWLQGRFEVRLLPYLVEQLTGAPATVVADAVQVVIDFKRPLRIDADAERAWQLAMHDKLQNQQIAAALGCSKTYVTNLLKHATAKRGVSFEDGRTRRARQRREAATDSVGSSVDNAQKTDAA